MAFDGGQDPVMIAGEDTNRVVGQRAARVPAMIPDVVDEHVEIVEERGPERNVEIDRQSLCHGSSPAADRPGCRVGAQ